jgi:ubiquinol-cytochrome c reductase cytochrome c subunit
VRRPGAGVLLLLAVGLALAGCSTPGDKVAPFRPPAYYEDDQARPAEAHGVALGQQLYQRDCGFCHGNQGQGTERAPDLRTGTNGPALTDFMLRTGRMPVDQPVSEALAGEAKYSDRETAAVVAYLTRQVRAKGPAIPRLDVAAGRLPRGQQLYQEHCGACHALTGIGGAMLAKKQHQTGTEGVTIPDFKHSSPLEIAEAVRTGPGTMPVFGVRAIDDDELNALVRYVTYLRKPDDHGGASIGHVGPVSEGAAGWIVGLGLLVLFCRWIGTRTGEMP